MKKAIFFILLVAGCKAQQSSDEIISQEIKLREARREHDLRGFQITRQTRVKDTFLIYYKAEISFHSKDSTVEDSLFFIKDKDSAMLPFLERP